MRAERATLLRALATAITFASFATAVAAEEIAPSVTAVGDLLGCSTADRDRLARGDLVALRDPARPLDESVAVIVAASPASTMLAMRRGDVFHADRRVLASAEIPPGPVDAATFASLPVAAPEPAELAPLGSGGGWNLSVTEQALLRDIANDEGDPGIAAAMRHILAERTAAYRGGGPRAIAPYARPGGAVFAAGVAAADLWRRGAKLDAFAPGLHAAIEAYPRSTALDLRHAFHASIVEHAGVPTVVLSHRIESAAEGYAIAVEREFFVSRGYAVRQVMLGAAAIGDGRSVAFYVSSSRGHVSSGRAPVVGGGHRDVEVLLTELRDLGVRAD